jgi:RNA polymerase sigma factor (sigma-70 family)
VKKGKSSVQVRDLRTLITQAANAEHPLAARHEAFAELVARFQDLAFGCAYAVLHDFYLAEDAAQQAFIAAWQKLGQLREPEAFPGWLRRLLLTECNRLTRGKRLRFVPLDAGLEVHSGKPDPHEQVAQSELRARVRSAIQSLPERERTVTTLFYIGEYSQAEIGEFLELPVTTVVKRLHTARQRLKGQIIEMFSDDLHNHRPSRDAAFAEQVNARLRPFDGRDWGLVSQFVYGLEGDFRSDDEAWLRNRRQFDETRYTRRQYLAEHAETGQLIGYGSIEQTIFLPKYRLFLFVAPEWLRAGVGDLLLDRLEDEMRAAGAICVWHRNYARLTELLDFLNRRGYAETRRVWDLRLNVADFDPAPFQPLLERLSARGITFTNFAAERARDEASLHRLHEFLNAVKADDPQRQPFIPVPFEAVVRWFEKSFVLPDACFIAKLGAEYIGFTDLNHIEPTPNGIMHGFTGVARAQRRQGIATALKVHAIEYARQHGDQTVRAFNLPAHQPMLALNEKLGFRRQYCYVTVEKMIRAVAQVDASLYDQYIGRYAPEPELLRQHGLPAELAITITRVGDKLFSELRDMQDELFPASETEFFTDHHYGQISFVKDATGRVTHLIYREAGLEAQARKLDV